MVLCARKQWWNLVETLIFTSGGPNRQKVCAATLQIRVSTKLKDSPNTSISVYDPPIKTVPIRGDGNCHFRMMSYYIVGGQHKKPTPAKKVVEFINTHNESMLPTVMIMLNPGEWGTEVEIHAFATLLRTPVYVPRPSGRGASNNTYKWLKYEPLKCWQQFESATSHWERL